MRIGIYDDNAYYLNRVCEIMNERYSDEMKLVPLNEKDLSGAGDISFDLLIVNEAVCNNVKIKAPIVYLTEKQGSLVENEKVSVFKYYNAQTMYETVLEAAEAVKRIAEERESKKRQELSAYNCKIITYLSLGGGMGSSTVAAGTAAYFARTGKRVLYISLDPIDSMGYFTVNGENVSMSDIVNDIEKNGNNADALFGNICVSSEGVFVPEGFRNSFEANKLNSYIMEEILALADRYGKFDVIITDVKVSTAEWIKSVLKVSSVICYVVDGSSCCNKKIFNANSFMSDIDEGLNNKLRIIYNKYKVMPKVEKSIEDKVMGGISYVESEAPQEIINKMLKMKFLNNLIK